MRTTVSITSKDASIVVILEAYERFFLTEENPAVTSFLTGHLFMPVEPQAVLVSDDEAEEWLKFQCLVAEWRVQRGAMSSITEAALCSAYQRIIGMGPVAVPFILSELASEGDEPDQWFWALKAITGEDPVSDEDRGDFLAMSHAWLDWAKRGMYAW